MTKEEMFNNNVNIAYKIANTYRLNYPSEFEDLRQIALERAVEVSIDI